MPGVSETAVGAGLVHGADQVCLAVRLLSGAGISAASSGVRCAAVDELPPNVELGGGVAWSGGAQTVTLTAGDANGASFSQVLIDGAAVAAPGGAVTISGEGAHVLRVVARDGAGNETVAERALGVDATAPSIARVAADFQAREVRIDVADALSGVGARRRARRRHRAGDAACGGRPYRGRAGAGRLRARRRRRRGAGLRRLDPREPERARDQPARAPAAGAHAA